MHRTGGEPSPSHGHCWKNTNGAPKAQFSRGKPSWLAWHLGGWFLGSRKARGLPGGGQSVACGYLQMQASPGRFPRAEVRLRRGVWSTDPIPSPSENVRESWQGLWAREGWLPSCLRQTKGLWGPNGNSVPFVAVAKGHL